MQCQIETRKPSNAITDRAQRYRARKCIEQSNKRCIFCGSNRKTKVHHLNGNESDTTPKNLVYACHSDNLLVGWLLKRFNIGRRIDRNPAAEPAKSLGQWVMAVKSMKGESTDMEPKAAIAMIRATSPARRSAFAERIWKIRRAHGTDKTRVPF